MTGDFDVLTALLLDPCLTVAEAERQAGAALLVERAVREVTPATAWDRPLPPDWLRGLAGTRG